jgi:hypothetical protein
MGRRRHREDAAISLLPMLSIQKCTMGVMVVIICAQNLVSIGKTADQYLEVVGTAKDREAVFVECRQEGVLIHPDKTTVALDTLKGQGPSLFHHLLNDLKASAGKRHLVLLVRPEGIPAYDRCVRMVWERKLDFGKDALLSGGNVVLTAGGRPLVSKGKGGTP